VAEERDQKQQSLVLARQSVALPVVNIQELMAVGEMLAKSGMFGIKNAEAGFVVAATCHQQGMSLMEFQRTYHIVENKPAMRADAMLAEFRNRGGRVKIVENSVTRAAGEFTFEGQTVVFEYTMDDAERTGDCYEGKSGNVKHTWQKRPEDMLWARLVSRSVRRLCPEINAGLYSPEEVADFDGARTSPRGAVPLDPEEAIRRAKAVQAEVEPATVGDASVCPDGYGDFSGKSWSELGDVELEMALDADGLTANHHAAIRLVIEERKAEKGGAA